MKKLIALILVTLLCGPAMAGTVDWSSVTDDEINAEIAAEQAGLALHIVIGCWLSTGRCSPAT